MRLRRKRAMRCTLRRSSFNTTPGACLCQTGISHFASTPTASCCSLWPEAEDRALRGRNLSAVFRTLYRQVGKPPKGLAFLCTHLAGRELKRKIHLPNPQPRSLTQDALNQKKTFPSHLHKILTKPSNRLSIFSGQPQHLLPAQVTRSHVQSHLTFLRGPPATLS